MLCSAVYIPVISAVGHEPDVTISDFVADLRAATPSNAAELAVPDQDAIRQNLDSYGQSMTSILNRQLKSARQHLNVLASRPSLSSPTGYLDQKRKNLELLENRLVSANTRIIEQKQRQFVSLTAKLDAMSPLKVLTRGYAMAQTEDGAVLKSVQQTAVGNRIKITLGDGSLTAAVTQKEES